MRFLLLCNFHKKDVTIFNLDNIPALNRKRNTPNGIWYVTITSPQYELTPTTSNEKSILHLYKKI